MPTIYAIILLFSSSAFGYEYKNTEALGRGGTHLSLPTNPATSLFVNPANLIHQQNFRFEISVFADSSNDAMKIIENTPELTPGQYQSTLDPYFGTYNHIQAEVMPTISYRGWSLLPYSVMGKGEINLTNKVFPEAKASIFLDYGSFLGKGFKVSDNLDMGLSLGYVTRTLHEGNISTLDFSEGVKQSKTTGHAFTSNLGANYKFNNSANSVISGSILNINQPSFFDRPALGTWGNELRRTVNLGYSSNLGSFDQVRVAVEMKNIFGNELFLNRVHTGLEYQPLSFLKLQAGLNEGYLSMGASLKVWKLLQIDVASYGENAYQYYRKESRNLSVNVSLGWLN